jgi:hypothetical protein
VIAEEKFQKTARRQARAKMVRMFFSQYFAKGILGLVGIAAGIWLLGTIISELLGAQPISQNSG